MRALVLTIVILVVLGQVVHSSRSRSREAGRRAGHQVHPLYKRVLRRGLNLSRRDTTQQRVKRDDCSDNCGDKFAQPEFQDCSNYAGYILGNDPDSAISIGGGATVCATKHCGDILPEDFKCIGQYCSGGNPTVCYSVQ